MNLLLEQAAAYIKAGNIEKGKQLLVEVLKQEPKDENTWLWMSRCVQNNEQKKECFERVLKINPQNSFAIEGLARLNQSNANLANSTSGSLGNNKPKSNKGVFFLLLIIGALFVCGVCSAGIFFLGLTNPTAIPTESTSAMADNLKAVMENRGYNFTEQTTSDGFDDQVGKSLNGISIVEIKTRGSQIVEATIMGGIPSDSQSAIEDNVTDMATFLNTASPGWNSTSWLASSIKQIDNDSNYTVNFT